METSLVPLEAPARLLEQLAAGISAAAARLTAAMHRRQGLQILVFATPDAESTVARLDLVGVPHTAVQRVRRQVRTDAGPVALAVGYVEIDTGPGRSPEGRIALAEPLPAGIYGGMARSRHPNGADELTGVILCVDDREVENVVRRYTDYTGRAPRPGSPGFLFSLGTGRLTILTPAELNHMLPGETPPEVPAFVAFAVRVRDLGVARAWMESAGLPVRTTARGELFVPALAALGVAVVFEAQRDA